MIPSQWKTAPLLWIVGGCFFLQLAVDWGLAHNVMGNRGLTALLDPVAHGSLAILVLIPWASAFHWPSRILIVGLAAALLIDLDHFIVAGSFSLNKAISLPSRPMAHSLLFCGSVAVLFALAMRSWTAFAAVCLALLSHLSRDASGGGITPLFWPSEATLRIPREIHLGFWTIFSLVGCWFNAQQKRGARATAASL